MAPVAVNNALELGTESISYGYLQVVLGCVLPFLLVASFIPIMMARRHVMYKNYNYMKRHSRIRSVAPTPRLPAVSVYIARLDYYLPNTNTFGTIPVTETQPSLGTEFSKSEVSLHTTPRSLAPELPLASLPSLPSILCEFAAYADVIEPENLSEARRSSTLLLDSSTNKGLTGLGLLPPESWKENVSSSRKTSLKSPENTQAGSAKDIDNCRFQPTSSTPSSYALKVECSNSPIMDEAQQLLAGEPPAMADNRVHADVADPCVKFNEKALIDDSTYTEDDHGVSDDIKSDQLAISTTQCSLNIEACDTWHSESLLSVRLSAFPAVPVNLPTNPLRGKSPLLTYAETSSSLQSFVSRSISAPASLNILELRFGPSFPQGLASTAQVILKHDSPGELWDEEDEIRFPVISHSKPINRLNRARHTWAAGVTYWRQNNDVGELWDDEDDRRVSVGGSSDAAATLVASLSVLSIGSHSEFAANFSSFISTGGLSLPGLTDFVASSFTLEKPSTVMLQDSLCPSSDDVNSAFIEEYVPEPESKHLETRSNVDCEEVSPETDKSPLAITRVIIPGASSSTLYLDKLEDLACEPEYLSPSLSGCDCESTHSSCMSFASVLSVVIYEADPAYSSVFDLDKLGGTDLNTIISEFTIDSNNMVVDMDLEHDDDAYTSRIVLSRFPLLHAY